MLLHQWLQARRQSGFVITEDLLEMFKDLYISGYEDGASDANFNMDKARKMNTKDLKKTWKYLKKIKHGK